MSLLLVVDERTVHVGVLDEVAQVVFPQQLRVLPALERRDLPARLPIVGLDGRHTLDGERRAQHGRTLELLTDDGREAALVQPPLDPQRLDRLDLLQAALGLDVLGDELVGGLRPGRGGQPQKAEHDGGDLAHSVQLLVFPGYTVRSAF